MALTSPPDGNVVVDVHSNSARVNANSTTLTFTTQNWNTEQVIRLSGANDSLPDNDGETTITLAVVENASAAGYAGVSLEAPVTIIDHGRTLDANGDTIAQPLSDGILAVRFIAGFTGAELTRSIDLSQGTRQSAAELTEYFQSLQDLLDIDGNGMRDALTDGILIVRYLAGFTGSVLINNAVALDATRSTSEIENHLRALSLNSSSVPSQIAGATPQLVDRLFGADDDWDWFFEFD